MINQNDIKILNYLLKKTITTNTDSNEFPVYAIIADASGTILYEENNKTIEFTNRLEHAECLLLKKIGTLTIPNNYTLYISLEPCLMCYGAALLYNVKRIIYLIECGKFGASTCHHVIPHNMLLMKGESYINTEDINTNKILLRNFFKDKR